MEGAVRERRLFRLVWWVHRTASMPGPSALPAISPTGGEITSGSRHLPIYRFVALPRQLFWETGAPGDLPTCGGDGRQARGDWHGTTTIAPPYSNRNASLLFVNLDSCCNRPSRRSPAKSRYSGGTTNSRSRSGFDDLRKLRLLTMPGIEAENR